MFADVLRGRLRGIAELSQGQLAALEAHYLLLLRWNKSLNLTKITALEEAVERHYVESIFLGTLLPPGSLRIADIGSGPGFPGLPVAVLRSDCEVTLIESHQRKAVFLREASRQMKNVRVVSKRAEEVEGGFDLGISRAVSFEDLAGPLSQLAAHVALLTGGEAPPISWKYSWLEPVPVPGSNARVVRFGKRSSSDEGNQLR